MVYLVMDWAEHVVRPSSRGYTTCRWTDERAWVDRIDRAQKFAERVIGGQVRRFSLSFMEQPVKLEEVTCLQKKRALRSNTRRSS